MNDESMNQTMDRVDELAPGYIDELAGESGCCGGGGHSHAPKSYSMPQQSAGSCGTGCGCHGPSTAVEQDFETRARKAINKLRREQPTPPPAPTERPCPYCAMNIPLKATRCPHCTSEVAAAA